MLEGKIANLIESNPRWECSDFAEKLKEFYPEGKLITLFTKDDKDMIGKLYTKVQEEPFQYHVVLELKGNIIDCLDKERNICNKEKYLLELISINESEVYMVEGSVDLSVEYKTKLGKLINTKALKKSIIKTSNFCK